MLHQQVVFRGVSACGGIADVYKGVTHVGTSAWDKNYSGGLYGRIANVTHNNLHSYVQGVYTIWNKLVCSRICSK